MSGSPKDVVSARLFKEAIVKVVWKDAIEGTIQQDTSRGRVQPQNKTTSIISTVGRYLKISNGYLVLNDVLQEESNGRLLYEKQGSGKWVAIPLGVITQVSTPRKTLQSSLNETKRRRTILNQVRLLARSKRLLDGEISRTMFVG